MLAQPAQHGEARTSTLLMGEGVSASPSAAASCSSNPTSGERKLSNSCAGDAIEARRLRPGPGEWAASLLFRLHAEEILRRCSSCSHCSSCTRCCSLSGSDGTIERTTLPRGAPMRCRCGSLSTGRTRKGSGDGSVTGDRRRRCLCARWRWPCVRVWLVKRRVRMTRSAKKKDPSLGPGP